MTRKEKQKISFFNWVKKHKTIIVISIFSIPFLLNIAIWIGNLIFNLSKINILNPAQITNNDWFTFWGSYLSSVATIFLGLVALKQNNEANALNRKMAVLTNQATLIESNMLKIENDRKKPFMIINEKVKMNVSFFPTLKKRLKFDDGEVISLNMPLEVDDFLFENTLLYNVSHDKSESSSVIVTINFQLLNMTENLIKEVNLENLQIRFISDKNKNYKNTFKDYVSPVCSKIIRRKKDICIQILHDVESNNAIKDFTVDFDWITILFDIDFIIKNIYDDNYKNSMSLILSAKHNPVEPLMLHDFPVLLSANVIP